MDNTYNSTDNEFVFIEDQGKSITMDRRGTKTIKTEGHLTIANKTETTSDRKVEKDHLIKNVRTGLRRKRIDL